MSGFALKFQQTKELTPPHPHPNRNVICDCWREEKKEKENQTVKASIFFRNAWKLQDINFRAFFFSFFLSSLFFYHFVATRCEVNCSVTVIVTMLFCLRSQSEWTGAEPRYMYRSHGWFFFFFFFFSSIRNTRHINNRGKTMYLKNLHLNQWVRIIKTISTI